MRHRKSFNHLGRKSGHRKAMLANMASSLIKHKRITTTSAKAKALRTYIEPIITRSKEDTTHSRRVVFSYLQDKDAVTELFRDVAGKIGERPGGYTRILKIGSRLGDASEMAIIELVDYNENLLGDTTAAGKAGTRRKRRSPGTRKKAESAAEPVAEKEVVTEKVDDKKVSKAEAIAPEADEAPSSQNDDQTPAAEEENETKES